MQGNLYTKNRLRYERPAPNSTNIGPRIASTASQPVGKAGSPVEADVGDAQNVGRHSNSAAWLVERPTPGRARV